MADNYDYLLLINYSFDLQILRAANLESDAENSDSPWALARPSSKTNSKSEIRRSTNSKYRVDELNEPSIRVPGIRALLPLPGGDLLTGGTDLKIRRWDHFRYLLLLNSRGSGFVKKVLLLIY